LQIETIDTTVVFGLQTNCYLVTDEATQEALVIDPGGSPEAILARVEQLGVRVVLVVNTHGHFDHIAADQDVLDATGAMLAAHRESLPLFQMAGGAAQFGLKLPMPPAPSQWLEDGEEFVVGQEVFKVLHTPGHTPGCISIWNAKHGVVFGGDLLFNGGIGRTDLPGGNYQQLMRSIHDKILTLPDATVVYPGHGPCTTVGRERRANPFL
jgi:hydroxyacylglutathione hydrolase